MVKKFFCFRLESTAIFFACLGIIYSVIMIIYSLYGPRAQENYIELLKKGYNESNVKLCLGIYIVFCIISGTANICLLLGTIKKRHYMILLWLIVSLLDVFFWIVFMFHTFNLIVILCIALSIYLWIAMFSLYQKIKVENETVSSSLVHNENIHSPTNCFTCTDILLFCFE
ncbi:uncharacterized protein LOC105216003 [Zeugodacus cucurbitae]|uniref:uncharacterized protein LOC105216003 n=1 Tax=Zeugodacus cucurbitae TaxID=28588 RepID=UPI000596885C|nr:uncharacterized protein LOC105216003 [Zeugodacus cucurbitae]